MNDKRSDSTRPSARPPLPSIAPPTDDIDSEWGAEEIPAPAKLPPASATPSYPPAPEPPPVRSSAPAPRPSSAPVATQPSANNALRKQTLLGIAPVIPPRASEPPRGSEPPRP